MMPEEADGGSATAAAAAPRAARSAPAAARPAGGSNAAGASKGSGSRGRKRGPAAEQTSLHSPRPGAGRTPPTGGSSSTGFGGLSQPGEGSGGWAQQRAAPPAAAAAAAQQPQRSQQPQQPASKKQRLASESGPEGAAAPAAGTAAGAASAQAASVGDVDPKQVSQLLQGLSIVLEWAQLPDAQQAALVDFFCSAAGEQMAKARRALWSQIRRMYLDGDKAALLVLAQDLEA